MLCGIDISDSDVWLTNFGEADFTLEVSLGFGDCLPLGIFKSLHSFSFSFS